MASPSRGGLAGRTYLVRTFGCQMNLHESERVSGLLDSLGCVCVAEPEDADIVVFMTCCVREKADDRLYGQVSAMVSMPEPPSGRRVVCVGGCLAQRDGATIREHAPAVDVVFGTQALDRLPAMVERAAASPSRELVVDCEEPYESFSTDLPQTRAQAFHAWVPIMYGCDNFCSYCIVPYVRGRERSRTMEDVCDEVSRLVADGVREVCLLGQNVNSYGRTVYGEPRFAELLRRVGECGVERIRFTSSNPKDLTEDVIRAMAEVPAVMPHLHLAVQSGSDRVLKAMNRRYTRDGYLRLVERLRDGVEGLALSTDLIVGFPGETEEDFLDTMSLVREAGFSSAYTFIYSRREGTAAARIPDDTPREVIQGRFDRLAGLVAEQAHEHNARYRGSVVEALVEQPSKRDPRVMVGHSPWNQTVHFALPEGRSAGDYVGHMVDVRVDEARTWYLFGEPVGEPR